MIHIGGIYHERTMNYLLGLRRTGHPVIILHIGREEPPDYPDFEVRDGRGLFLEPLEDMRGTDYSRPASSSGKWDEFPVSAATPRRGGD